MAATGQVSISGNVSAGPTVSGDTVFPSGGTTIAFNLNIAQKPFGASSGVQSEAIASPSSFVQLPGVDATIGTVKNANTVYVRAGAAVDLRVTQRNPAGGVTTYVVKQLKGMYIIEVDDPNAIQMLEVQGTATVEWGAWGNS